MSSLLAHPVLVAETVGGLLVGLGLIGVGLVLQRW
jgi:hypothetical protein